MYVCYVDEAGCTGCLYSANCQIQPVLVIGGLFVPQYALSELTRDFLDAKGRFYPDRMRGAKRFLDRALVEIKGADLRRDFCEADRRARRRATAFLAAGLSLLEKHDVRVVAKVFVKGIGASIDGTAVYGTTLQYICKHFQHFLTSANAHGFVIADARNKPANVRSAHSIFTQKHQQSGDTYNRIVEMPTFGHSDNHVGLQLADLLCSGVLFPLAVHSYCATHVKNKHVRPEYAHMKRLFGGRVGSRQYRYEGLHHTKVMRWIGGITVLDGIAGRSGALLLR